MIHICERDIDNTPPGNSQVSHHSPNADLWLKTHHARIVKKERHTAEGNRCGTSPETTINDYHIEREDWT